MVDAAVRFWPNRVGQGYLFSLRSEPVVFGPD